MRVLFATDGSQGSRDAAHLLNGITFRPTEEIIVLSVRGKGEEAATQDLLDRTCAILQTGEASVSQVVASGRPAETILRRAAALDPDLIALGSRGLNAVARFVLGSVAERVVSLANCPVLVARTFDGDLDQIVVGIDDSATALCVAQFVQRLPLPPSCKTCLATSLQFHAVAGTPADRISGLAAELHAIQEHAAVAAGVRLKEIAETFNGRGLPVSTWFVERHPAEGLLEVAEAHRADILAVGRQGNHQHGTLLDGERIDERAAPRELLGAGGAGGVEQIPASACARRWCCPQHAGGILVNSAASAFEKTERKEDVR